MTIAIILVLAGFLALAALVFLAKGQCVSTIHLPELRQRINGLDINAFRRVIDPDEEEFLRQRLTPADFRMVQRERLRAAIGYIVVASNNAALLHRIGDSVRFSTNSSMALAGANLANCAIQFRLYTFQILARLYLALILPNPSVYPFRIADGYQNMNNLVVLLCCLQQQGRRSSSMVVAQLS